MKKILIKVLLATTILSSMVGVTVNAQTQKIIGSSNRYSTAVEISKHAFQKSDVAVLVNGGATADGLAMTPLAKQYKAPILLTTGDKLHNDTKSELIRLGVKKVIIGGGFGVVSEAIEAELKSLNIEVERIAGSNRYQTSNAIAKKLATFKEHQKFTDIVIVNGNSTPDSLSIASVAGMLDMPIFLTNGVNLDNTVLDILKNNVTGEVHYVGGEGVVKPSILQKVKEIKGNDFANNRLGGKNRYETNAKVIDKFFSDKLERAYMAKGYDNSLVDALAVGSPAAIHNSPVVLVNAQGETSKEQKDILYPRVSDAVYQAGLGLPETGIKKLGEILSVTEMPEALKTVYWTPNGKSYHSTKECPTLSRSKEILEGTLEESGKVDRCNICH